MKIGIAFVYDTDTRSISPYPDDEQFGEEGFETDALLHPLPPGPQAVGEPTKWCATGAMAELLITLGPAELAASGMADLAERELTEYWTHEDEAEAERVKRIQEVFSSNPGAPTAVLAEKIQAAVDAS